MESQLTLRLKLIEELNNELTQVEDQRMQDVSDVVCSSSQCVQYLNVYRYVNVCKDSQACWEVWPIVVQGIWAV